MAIRDQREAGTSIKRRGGALLWAIALGIGAPYTGLLVFVAVRAQTSKPSVPALVACALATLVFLAAMSGWLSWLRRAWGRIG